jgi:hypothetical protein
MRRLQKGCVTSTSAQSGIVSGIDDLAISHTRNCDDRHIEGLEKGDGGTTEQPVSCDAQNNEDQQETDSNEQAFAQGHITAAIRLSD